MGKTHTRFARVDKDVSEMLLLPTSNTTDRRPDL